MDTTSISEAIWQTNGERILFAMNRLLPMEEEIPEGNMKVVVQRRTSIDEGAATTPIWEDIKDRIFKK